MVLNKKKASHLLLRVQLIFWLTLQIAPSVGVKFLFYCSISTEDVITLRYNTSISEYQEDTEDDSSTRQRVLRSLSRSSGDFLELDTDIDRFSEDMFDLSSIQIATTLNEIRRAQDYPSPPEALKVKLCPCAGKHGYPSEKFYCPLSKDYCAVPGIYDRDIVDPICLNLRNNEIFVRSVWPVVLIWFGLSAIFCFFTVPGRNALDCCISSVCPCWNRFVVSSIMRRNPNRANLMIQRYWNRRRQQLEQRYRERLQNINETEVEMQQVQRPTELALKTKIYKAEESGLASAAAMVDDENFEDNQGQSCSICFVPIEDGDRVGALPCNHIFHVDCLKGWLKRRNVCPLCMQTDVAPPRDATPDSGTR